MDEERVKKLVENGEDLTLGKLVDSIHYCGMNCNILGNNPRWGEFLILFVKKLTKLILEKFSGTKMEYIF
jgi:hypothetical protein